MSAVSAVAGRADSGQHAAEDVGQRRALTKKDPRFAVSALKPTVADKAAAGFMASCGLRAGLFTRQPMILCAKSPFISTCSNAVKGGDRSRKRQ